MSTVINYELSQRISFGTRMHKMCGRSMQMNQLYPKTIARIYLITNYYHYRRLRPT